MSTNQTILNQIFQDFPDLKDLYEDDHQFAFYYIKARRLEDAHRLLNVYKKRRDQKDIKSKQEEIGMLEGETYGNSELGQAYIDIKQHDSLGHISIRDDKFNFIRKLLMKSDPEYLENLAFKYGDYLSARAKIIRENYDKAKRELISYYMSSDSFPLLKDSELKLVDDKYTELKDWVINKYYGIGSSETLFKIFHPTNDLMPIFSMIPGLKNDLKSLQPKTTSFESFKISLDHIQNLEQDYAEDVLVYGGLYLQEMDYYYLLNFSLNNSKDLNLDHHFKELFQSFLTAILDRIKAERIIDLFDSLTYRSEQKENHLQKILED